MQVIDRAFVRGLMPARDPGGHKGDLRQGLSAGRQRRGTPRAGAVRRRGGTQRLRAGVPRRAGDGVAHRGGQMPVRYASSTGGAGRKALRGRGDGDTPPCRRCDAVAVGCGLGRSEGSDALVRALLTLEKPLVLDATA